MDLTDHKKMILLAENKEVLNRFNKKFNLLDSSIYTLNFSLIENRLSVRFDFVLRYPMGKRISLEFSDVTKYSFCFSSANYFYTVGSYKFENTAEGFYISLDPDDTEQKILESDNDCIVAKSVKLFEEKTII